MRRLTAFFAIGAVVALALIGSAGAVPGNGKNAFFIFNDCDSGVGEIVLVNQASLTGAFATAHIVGSNRPAPLVSLDYEIFIGEDLIDSGSIRHEHPQQGQPLISCTGSFTLDELRFEVDVTAFLPAGS